MSMPTDAWSGRWEGEGHLTGELLVASPRLPDPNFERSVILLLDHGEAGALGIVLNRPTPLAVEEILEPWHDQATMAPPGVVFAGGPVSREAVIGLARLPDVRSEPEASVTGRWRPVLDRLGTVDLSVSPEDQPFPLAGARLFSGYAGWDAGQLEGEIDEGAWFVLSAAGGDLLCAEPDRLWHDVLRRQAASLAMLATYPPHPSVN
jgi:putative transcriptional regulator